MKVIGFFICCFFLFFFPTTGICQRNMSESRPEIRILLAEKTAKYWTNAEIDTAWNRAQRLVGLYAGIIIPKQDTITTAAGTDAYLLNSDFFRIRSVWRGSGQNRRPITIVDDPYSLESEGAAVPSEYCWVHAGTLFLFPPPVGAEKIYIFYYAVPALRTTDTATTELPQIIHKAPIWEAASDLINADYKYEIGAGFHSRALEIIAAYRGLIQIQGDKPSEPQK
jgi:hypothetical protein